MSAHFSIGWDVGGWNCDKNASSRDAIVILDSNGKIAGIPWRGNLRDLLNHSNSAEEWTEGLFQLCGVAPPRPIFSVTMAIDTPLGFSEEFVALVAGMQPSGPVGSFKSNTYLFRQTERFLFEHGFKPMSAVNHQIGSQATKGMHALARFAPHRKSCGVWTDGRTLYAIEAYPSASRKAEPVTRLTAGIDLQNDDKQDALVCAAIAHLFHTAPACLEPPTADVPAREGWIWTPAIHV
jgi:hypothetical protein